MKLNICLRHYLLYIHFDACEYSYKNNEYIMIRKYTQI